MSFMLEGAWRRDLRLKREAIDRVALARADGRLTQELQSSWLPHRRGQLCRHIISGPEGLQSLPDIAGLKINFGQTIDALFRMLPKNDALAFSVDVLEAVELGADVEPAIFALELEILRKHRGSNQPIVSDAIAGVINLVEPFALEEDPADLRPGVAYDAIAECEYSRECIRRKKILEPKMSWAWDAALLAESLARIVNLGRSYERESKFAELWRWTHPRDVDAEIADRFIAALSQSRCPLRNTDPLMPAV